MPLLLPMLQMFAGCGKFSSSSWACSLGPAAAAAGAAGVTVAAAAARVAAARAVPLAMHLLQTCGRVPQLLLAATAAYVAHWNKTPQARAAGRALLRLRPDAKQKGGLQAVELETAGPDEQLNPQVAAMPHRGAPQGPTGPHKGRRFRVSWCRVEGLGFAVTGFAFPWGL